MSHRIYWFSEITFTDRSQVGGKGFSLAQLFQAGFPVPNGFCIATVVNPSIDSTFQDILISAYNQLGSDLVAVRSSANWEDGSTTSFAGQHDTFLNVAGETALLDAVSRCRQSLYTDRAKAYRQQQGIDESSMQMAVVVQRMIPAKVAGVLFSRDPREPTSEWMQLEAVVGFGEPLVSGKIQPDRWEIHRTNGTTRKIDQPNALALTDQQLHCLWDLGNKVESFFGSPVDLEWAIADDQLWLLQARPITPMLEEQRQQIRQNEIDKLRNHVPKGGTVWVRQGLVELLPEPTPLSWEVVSKYLLSANGASGQMYRDFGFTPDPSLGWTSAYDLIAGRPYLNLEREPRLQSRQPLHRYPLMEYQQHPERANQPKMDRKLSIGSIGWWRFPWEIWKLLRTTSKILKQVSLFPEEFRDRYVPAYTRTLQDLQRESLSRDSEQPLQKRLMHCLDLLKEFGRQSLKPTLFAEFCLQVLEQHLAKPLGSDRCHSALAELCQGAKPDPEADLPQAIQELLTFRISQQTFLERFGHRGPWEMELAQPRWSEDPTPLNHWTLGTNSGSSIPISEIWDRIASEAKLSGYLKTKLFQRVQQLQTHLGLRETGKHHLLKCYAELRRTLLALDHFLGDQGNIFYLELEELTTLTNFQMLQPRLAQRRKERSIALTLELPYVITSPDLEAIGRPLPPPMDGKQFQGIAISPGVAEGVAWVCTDPSTTRPPEGTVILVCRSTDPAWVPLFAHVKGLILETGGMLSHGAIVARELGLPAVAGLPNICNQIQPGQLLHLNGTTGLVVQKQ